MPNAYEGGCHCGAVRYSCAAEPELTFYCHCHDCQRTTGSPFSVEMMIPDSSFKIEGALAAYVVTGDSGKPVTRWHCEQCASGIYLEGEADPGYIFLKVGSLDDASGITPQMHIYTSAQQSWLKIDDNLPRYEKAPEG